MRISEESIKRQATAYIKDGVLVKWRFNDSDTTTFYARMCEKYQKRERLTEEEVADVKAIGNVVIEQERTLEFIGFTGSVWRD
ncbi:hypothetical protein ACTFR8_24550 [Bacillus cereus group sp. MYBK15-3]|uniref:hypothetical protein n=1 Tax=Bacillus cereus group TaxID=86661 RepID=UPI001C8B5735|nr:hypothetical protein [Bacillus cereus]MBX9158771.1 hypothetical protein [Bacillus cereus]